MNFMDSYKQLEKLCSEIYSDNHGISSYIDEMTSKYDGSRYVRNWDTDLKRLKHCRWVRNKVVHDPSCTEENTCEYGDSEWLCTFYSRIMSGSDPLTLYRKVKTSQGMQKSKQTTQTTHTPHTRTTPQSAGCLTCFIGILLTAVAVVLIGIVI